MVEGERGRNRREEKESREGGKKSFQKRKAFIWRTIAGFYLLNLSRGRNHAQNSFIINVWG